MYTDTSLVPQIALFFLHHRFLYVAHHTTQISSIYSQVKTS